MRFETIVTDRLLIREFRESDEADLLARRNDPKVAEFQNWKLPVTPEQAHDMAVSLAQMDGPEDDDWYMPIVVDKQTGTTVGELALHCQSQMRTAEVGYTFSPEHWGKGYAVEALSGLVAWLFDTVGVSRVFGMLHPDNTASAQVLERSGFLFEGHTRLSYWLGDENSDDWIYGMTRPDWETWRSRPRTAPEEVTLVEVGPENLGKVEKLKTHKTQEEFVAPMWATFADALFPEVVDGAPVMPWMRAVMADGEYVGFVMLALVTDHHPEPYLWRLLIDRLHQRRGIGRKVLDLVVEECKTQGAETLLTSWQEGRGTPEPFYLSYGFEKTGKIIDGEPEARLRFE